MKALNSDNDSSHFLIKQTVRKLYTTFLISSVTLNICFLIDGLCTSVFVGVNGVAAIGIIAPIGCISWLFINILGKGGVIVSGQKIGKGDTKSAKAIFNFILVLELVIALIYSTVIFIFSEPLAFVMGAEDILLPYATSYLKGLSLGFPFLILYGVLMHFCSFDGAEKNRLFAMAAITVTDIICNILFAKLLGLGMFGLGLATACSNLAGFLFLLPPYLKKDHIISIDLKSSNPAFLSDILKKGIPEGSFEICNFLCPVIINKILIYFGGILLVSILAVVNSAKGTLNSIIYAIGDTSVSMGSFFTGEEDTDSIVQLGKSTLYNALAYDICVSLLIIVFLNPISNALSGGSIEVSMLSHPAFLCVLISLFFTVFAETFARLYFSQGKSTLVSVYNILSYFILPIFFALICVSALPMNLKWIYIFLPQLTILVLIYIAVALKIKTFIPSFEQMITFASTFKLQNEDRLFLSVNNKESSIEASSRVIDFIKQHDLPSKTAYFGGLAVEEMTINILAYGYKKNNLKNIAVCAIYKENKIEIKIRDNGISFNPTSYAAQFTNEDPTKNIGIKMTARISKEMNYQNLFHLNMLTIKL
ncbi:MAG: ATP-binding protein [Butyrivibrio sp.]|nr:ATP-binding protein [Butyrivibrio sp.]